jgi:hypothetical protein
LKVCFFPAPRTPYHFSFNKKQAKIIKNDC